MSRPLVAGPVTVDAGELVMRSPLPRDARDWSAARLANQKWIEPAFPAIGENWADEQDAVHWVGRWLRMREQRRLGARPMVVFVDGTLVGEIGIDAFDPVSNTGEGSAWLVRDHGGPSVMMAASALMLRHAFTTNGGRPPMARVLSPVATAASRGRAPGLRAVGFELEATIPRPVGHGPDEDHDMWVVHNTAETRALLDTVLHDLGAGRTSTARPPARTAENVRFVAPALTSILAKTTARSMLRGLAGRGRSATDEALRPLTTDATVVLGHDTGTAAASLVPRFADGTPSDPDAVASELGRLADASDAWAPGAHRVEIRLLPPSDALGDRLSDLGFTSIAQYRANLEAGYPGEQVWARSVSR